MLIGQLSSKTGFSRDAIRFYEKQGLIPVGDRKNPFNNYKDYPEKTLEKLLVIKKMKGFGFTLNEIADFMELLELDSASCGNVSKKMIKKVALIENKIRELKEMKKLIVNGMEFCPNQDEKSENCPLISIDL